MGSLPLQAFHYYGQPIMATPVHTAEVAEKPTCPAGRDENANAKNGLTFDSRPTMAKRRPISQPGLFVRISLWYLIILEFHKKNPFNPNTLTISNGCKKMPTELCYQISSCRKP